MSDESEIWINYSDVEESQGESLLVLSGYNVDGTATFIARFSWFGEFNLPAKIILKDPVEIYVASLGREDRMNNCEVLIDTGFSWIPFSGAIPSNAVKFGLSLEGEQQYIGRAYINHSLTHGRILKDTNFSEYKLHLPYEGKEKVTNISEILIKGDISPPSASTSKPSSTSNRTVHLSSCAICLEQNVEICGILMDCGHACLCEACINLVNTSNRNSNGKVNCPICRKESPSARKIFYC